MSPTWFGHSMCSSFSHPQLPIGLGGLVGWVSWRPWVIFLPPGKLESASGFSVGVDDIFVVSLIETLQGC